MAEVMREKTMREVEAAGASRRPEGVKHLLDLDKKRVLSTRNYARPCLVSANYDEDRDEWGGPKGEEPTRYGDWERNGRATDFRCLSRGSCIPPSATVGHIHCH